ncbi:MAG: AbrB/MazE/SpoVT family DNA-binding domain-containing protein [Thermoprotei archaeon]|nr:MAG: AbrB/MazE/SpoVT family DNA-binding domain-containing protein [Thermoprotei archaeon]
MREVVVTRKYQVTIPKEVREELGIKVGDRLLVSVRGDCIVLEPIKPSSALERLASIADRLLGGPRRIDAVRLVEESIEGEAGVH